MNAALHLLFADLAPLVEAHGEHGSTVVAGCADALMGLPQEPPSYLLNAKARAWTAGYVLGKRHREAL